MFLRVYCDLQSRSLRIKTNNWNSHRVETEHQWATFQCRDAQLKAAATRKNSRSPLWAPFLWFYRIVNQRVQRSHVPQTTLTLNMSCCDIKWLELCCGRLLFWEVRKKRHALQHRLALKMCSNRHCVQKHCRLENSQVNVNFKKVVKAFRFFIHPFVYGDSRN